VSLQIRLAPAIALGRCAAHVGYWACEYLSHRRLALGSVHTLGLQWRARIHFCFQWCGGSCGAAQHLKERLWIVLNAGSKHWCHRALPHRIADTLQIRYRFACHLIWRYRVFGIQAELLPRWLYGLLEASQQGANVMGAT